LSDYFKQFLLSFFNKFSHEFLLPLLNLYFTTALTTVSRGLSLPLKPSHSRHPLALQKVLEYKQQRLKPVSPCLEFCWPAKDKFFITLKRYGSMSTS
jgi:hypothetical protein